MPKRLPFEQDKREVVGKQTYAQLWESALKQPKSYREVKQEGFEICANLAKMMKVPRRTMSDQLSNLVDRGKAERIEVKLDSGRIGFAYRLVR